MKYYILLNKIEKLEALLKRAMRKGGQISYSRGEDCYQDGVLYVRDPITHTEHARPIKVKCAEVEVNGSYKIDGWEFAGTVQHTPNGNVIRLANSGFEGKVPERYYSSAPICEHCGTHRERKDTYLIRNAGTGEWKQVGRACLMDFTNGMDADECALIMSNLVRFESLQGADLDLDEFRMGGSFAAIPSKSVKSYATALVKRFGYAKRDASCPTVDDLSKILLECGRLDSRLSGIEPDESLIPEIDEYVSKVQTLGGYMYNAKVAWLNEWAEYRDFGLIASLIAVYLREQEKVRQNKERKSEFVGEVGSKVEFEAASVKVVSFNSMFNTRYYAITGTDGNVYMWSTGTEVEPGMRFKATVKSHGEWKGLRQTVITRGKAI